MKRIHPNRTQTLIALDIMKFFLILALVLMFVKFNSRVAQNAVQTKTIAQSTNNVVKSQRDILAAIKAVTDDTHTTAAQQTAIIICMLQVPIEQRTTDLQRACRGQVSSSDVSSSDGTGQNSGGTVLHSSSPQPTTTSTSTQSNSSQAPLLPNCKVDVLFLHLGC